MLQCTRCKGVVYCNTTCQSGHWQAHRVVCLSPSPAAPAAASVSGGQTDTPTKQPPAKVGGPHRAGQASGAGADWRDPRCKRSDKLGRREALIKQIDEAAFRGAAASGGFDTSTLDMDIDRKMTE